MLFHFLKFSIRNLGKNRGYSFLNLFGLVVGAASCIIILQYVFLERSFDNFHENKADIYRLRLDFVSGDRMQSYGRSFDPLSQYIARDYPEVIASGRLTDARSSDIYRAVDESDETPSYNELDAYRADQAFWNMFSFTLLRGNEENFLSEPGGVALSEANAMKYFGTTDVLGRFIQRNNSELLKVTGVFENIPKNSHLKMDMILSLPPVRIHERTWTSWGTYNYIQLQPGTDTDQLSKVLHSYIDQFRKSPSYDMKLVLQPLTSIHFDQSTIEDSAIIGDEKKVDLLYIMAIVIITIAWVNYVNLSSASSLNRGKEVAMRKVFGARKLPLLLQCLVESTVLHFLSWLLALMIVFLLSGNLDFLFDADLGGRLMSPAMAAHLLFFLLFGSVLSGIYPALILGKFQVKTILKGRNAASTTASALRKILVTLQYAASMSLIIITLVVFEQIEFMRNADLGIKVDETIIVDNPILRDSTIFRKLDVMKERLLSTPGIMEVAYGQDAPGSPARFSFGGVRQMTETVGHQIKVSTVEPDYAEFYQIEFVAGRNVSKEIASDQGKVYINETARKLLGFSTPEEALNKELYFPRENVWIIGVVKDFHFASVKDEVNPVLFQYRPEYWPFGLDEMSVRVAAGATREMIDKIKDIYLSIFPHEVFDYRFLDQKMERQYAEEKTFGKLFGFFSALAIIIANLGLFGLISFSIVQRLKEMSIRKVLGANPGQIMLLFSGSFFQLLILSALISIPLSFQFLENWLNDFALHISLKWYMMVLPLAGVFLLTALLVSLQTLKASRVNPSRYLRVE